MCAHRFSDVRTTQYHNSLSLSDLQLFWEIIENKVCGVPFHNWKGKPVSTSQGKWSRVRYQRRADRKQLPVWANIAQTLLVKIIVEVGLRLWGHFAH